ncbi:MAG: thiamine phosphate synthase [Phycisphaerales bacterium]|nr:thiamine phosphate synthase [Phycisphaerales bacterium]
MHTITRIIDANANRAREGLRVLEDSARFVLDDPALSEGCKRARHALQRALAGLPVSELDLLASRNTPGDVGTTISTDLERARSHGLASVVSAAGKRVGEALRAIEESAKVLGADSSGFERIRYSVYELEKQIRLRLTPPCPQWALCVLLTRDLCRHHPSEEIIKLAVEGGAECIQIREKSMSDAELLPYAARLVAICRSVGVHVMVNDRVSIARLVGADGVHLGQNDLPTDAAREILGHGRWIGRTCATLRDALDAIEHGADCCGIGPMFASTTKPKEELSGTELLRGYLDDPKTAAVPHLAISGITPENISGLVNAGCRGVAVCGAVIGSADPRAACRALVDAIHAPTLSP